MELRSGIKLEITVIGMIIEMTVSIVSGVAAGSTLQVAFGIDSLIELIK